MRVFLDSSAWAKRFLREQGTDKVLATCAEATEIGIAVICLPEVFSALNRLRRERVLARPAYDSLADAVIRETAHLNVCDITPKVVARSLHLIEENVLRAMDALHVACAVEWGCDLFVSADRRQQRAARRAGLATTSV